MTEKELFEYYIDESIEILSNPTYNPLEVGFRHGGLSLKEENARLKESIGLVLNNLTHLKNSLISE